MLAFNKTPMLLKRFERDCGVVAQLVEVSCFTVQRICQKRKIPKRDCGVVAQLVEVSCFAVQRICQKRKIPKEIVGL